MLAINIELILLIGKLVISLIDDLGVNELLIILLR